MGNYDPDAPFILGQEWVPIFDTPDFQMVPTGNLLEQGHSFVLPGSRALSEGRFFFKDLPPGMMYGQAFQVSLYTRGQEGLSGPIQRVMVPCNSAAVSGSTPPQIIGTAGITAAQAVFTPNDANFIQFSDLPAQATTQRLKCSFAITPVLPQILNKRILGVNLVYMIGGQVAEYLSKTNIRVFLRVDTGTGPSLQDYGTIQGEEGSAFTMTAMQFHRTHFGELDQNAHTGLSDIVPWVTANLAKFEPGTVTNPYSIEIVSDATSTNTATTANQIYVYYAALEILYCEETRLAYGQVYYSDLRFPILSMGVNNVTMKTANTLVATPVITAGTYTAMLSSPDVGDYNSNTVSAKSGAVPDLRAPRQLYQVSSHIGVKTQIPFPIENHVGDVFATSTTDVLPQISLHTTGAAAWPEVHVYGQQIAAQVWGTITAVQGIDGSNGPSAASYPQARFWARRFGATTVPLQLASGASTASITAAAFDLLPEIMSGWKEVDLRFVTPPTMGTASGTTAWTFSAAGESPGNRWEVLGAAAYSVSGSPGNLLTPYPTGPLDAATYLQPAGATARLSWLAPQVSGTTADSFADASLYFSQDPPTVTGLVISQLSQAVTGVNLDCTSPPLSIPTGIAYQRIQWTSTSATGSGFGYYELQRQDTIDTTWRTIMKTTSRAVTGFNDYESRVGIQSSYQIRVANALGFVGSWSVTGTGTIVAPGVTGRGVSAGILLFSSNYAQSGVDNLAYMENWDDTAIEDLTFPEASRNKLVWMYGKNDMSAFRPLERGGEQFTRVLLTQNFVGVHSRLHNAFRSLRDMAWAQLPYVCVRNELGDRWFSNIVVPGGSLQRGRAIQLVQMQLTEITDTPYPVDPAL